MRAGTVDIGHSGRGAPAGTQQRPAGRWGRGWESGVLTFPKQGSERKRAQATKVHGKAFPVVLASWPRREPKPQGPWDLEICIPGSPTCHSEPLEAIQCSQQEDGCVGVSQGGCKELGSSLQLGHSETLQRQDALGASTNAGIPARAGIFRLDLGEAETGRSHGEFLREGHGGVPT